MPVQEQCLGQAMYVGSHSGSVLQSQGPFFFVVLFIQNLMLHLISHQRVAGSKRDYSEICD